MTTRHDLAAAVRALIHIERHNMSEEPEGKAQEVAFVLLPGEGRLRAAIWSEGEWRSDKGKRFDVAPIHWYSVGVRK